MNGATEPRTFDWQLALIVAIGAPFVRLLGATWRVRVTGRDALDAIRREKRAYVLSCWHGELLAAVWAHRGQGMAPLISEHRDGEIIARICERLGYGTVRGSSTRGGARALLGLVRTLEQGTDVAVTPDGPRGPAERYAPGALVAAKKAHAPIVAIRVRASRAWRLRSWDRFLIPKPFARVVLAYSAPTYVSTDDGRTIDDEVRRFQALMDDTLETAGDV
jgi:lysophospholipid acyltransferase (LPLAT)-like uncharacterized protein